MPLAAWPAVRGVCQLQSVSAAERTAATTPPGFAWQALMAAALTAIAALTGLAAHNPRLTPLPRSFFNQLRLATDRGRPQVTVKLDGHERPPAPHPPICLPKPGRRPKLPPPAGRLRP